MVIMGADVSGNTADYGQSKYIAIIMGTEKSINKIYQKIGLAKIHMVSLPDSKRQKVFRGLKFNNEDLLGLCLNVERQKTINYIVYNTKLDPKNKPKDKIQKHFDYLLLRAIRSKIESFVFPRNCEIKDVVMQCDSDMNRTGKNWSMRAINKGQAYEIADAVAWCNSHGKSIKQCVEIDLADTLRKEMKHDLLK